MSLGFFDIQSLVGLSAKDGYDFIKEKMKKVDSDFNAFLGGLKKIIKAACNEYRMEVETRHPYRIDLPETYDDHICSYIIKNLKNDQSVRLNELPLPDDDEMPPLNKGRFFFILEEKLIFSFEYYIRSFIGRTDESLKKINGGIAYTNKNILDVSKKVDKINKSVSQLTSAVRPECHFLTTPPPRVSKEFLHRDSFIDEICKAINTESKILLVNGLGGIGKTSVAKALFHKLEDSYTYVAWVEYNGNLKQSMLTSVKPLSMKLEKLFEDMTISDERKYGAIKDFLDESRDTLLIIDNVSKTDIDDKELQWLETMKNTVILTSRINEIGTFESYLVDSLGQSECIDIFYGYYKGDKSKKFIETVKNLVELANKHTLTVELLAKAANRPGTILNDYYNDLVEKGFGYSDFKFETQHTREKYTSVDHIKILYDLIGINPEQENILKNFAVMPSIEIPFEVEKWLDADVNDLADLVNLGWLHEMNNGYYMHPIIKESILLKSEIKFTECEKIINYMASYDYNYDNQTEFTSKVRVLLNIDDTFFYYFKREESKFFFKFCAELGVIYLYASDYEKALEFLNKALVVSEKINGTESYETAIAYSQIGNAYEWLGEFEKALEFFNKALVINEKINGTEHHETAIAYSQIGNAYEWLGEFEKALEFFNKALVINEKINGTEHHETAVIYSYIGSIYNNLGEFEKALEYLNKALAVWEKVCGTQNFRTIETYKDISSVYFRQGNYQKTTEFYNKSMEKLISMEDMFKTEYCSTVGLTYDEQGENVTLLKFLVWLR